jgi:hypothetical protein
VDNFSIIKLDNILNVLCKTKSFFVKISIKNLKIYNIDIMNEKNLQPEKKEAKEEATEPEVLRPDTQEKQVIEAEVEKLSAGEKEKLGWGLSTIGYRVEKMKNDFFAQVIGKSTEKLDKQKTLGKFCQELKKSFERDSREAEKKVLAIKSEEGKKFWSQIGNAGKLTSNVLKYGRIVADVTGASIANPFRYAMMFGMATARVAEVGKEVSMQTIDEQNRIQDADKAAGEAWALYEKAGGGFDSEGKASGANVKNIGRMYSFLLTPELIEKLKNPTTSLSFVKKATTWFVESRLLKLDEKLEEIAHNTELDMQEKQKQCEKLLDRWKKELGNYERMITQYGTVDEIAFGMWAFQKGSKLAVLGLQIETAVISVEKLFEHLHLLGSHVSMEKPAIGLSAKINPPGLPKDYYTNPAMTGEIHESLNPDAVVHKGEGIEHTFIRQIEHDPKMAQTLGFKGDANDQHALHLFAQGEAHRIALKYGYVESGRQVGITEGNKIAFELKVENGHTVITEKTVDGKVLGNFDDTGGKGYGFGKNDDNPYEKEFVFKHQELPKTPTETAVAETRGIEAVAHSADQYGQIDHIPSMNVHEAQASLGNEEIHHATSHNSDEMQRIKNSLSEKYAGTTAPNENLGSSSLSQTLPTPETYNTVEKIAQSDLNLLFGKTASPSQTWDHFKLMKASDVLRLANKTK